MTELILVRHGETDWNRELRFQGHMDVPLNAAGLEQARRVAERLAGEAAHHLACSDLLRARQTAEPLVRQLWPGLRLDMVANAALREQHFGMMEGLRWQDIERDHPEAWAHWRTFGADSGMPGGETRREFHARVMAALRALAAAHAGRTLVVVTHGGVLDMVWRTARGTGLDGPRQSEIPNAGINRVRLAGEAVEILQWADTRHLAGMPAQPVYDQRAVVAQASATPSRLDSLA
ncbi:histidine phosphatase family protein [Ramlibacter sp. H39-3-26]|uniref:histidine phosphatase family protein n=1 Tax=Curvibacter soli TaxID=3031331 RepID=UPI0023DB28F0|nr:histidine phosphatase family protein [Ramlibacter sp. H39-3-26]MDF1484264.1 histidine phosphatase family protein [Ramlibacter sp. H39-3-26]